MNELSELEDLKTVRETCRQALEAISAIAYEIKTPRGEEINRICHLTLNSMAVLNRGRD
jgi:hypothetical protein